MTLAKTTLQLTTYDYDNLDRLAKGTVLGKADSFHTAMAFCDAYISYLKRGYVASALYEDGYTRSTTNTFSARHIADSINARRHDLTVTPTDLALHRATADRLENIKSFLNVQSDTLAVAFALELAHHAFKTVQSCNDGKKATIFFSLRNRPGESGYLLNERHPYNVNKGNDFRRAVRRWKARIPSLRNPFKKAAAAALPAPAATPAPAQPAASTPDAPLQQEIKLLQSPTVNKRVRDHKPDQSGQGFGL